VSTHAATFGGVPACYKLRVRGARGIVIGCVAAAGSAHADPTIGLTVRGDVATTDNVFAVANDREGDVYVQVRPGLIFAYEAPRTSQELFVEGEMVEYFRHSDAPSFGLRGGWKGFFLPTPRSELLLAANGGTGTLNALTARTTPDQTAFAVLPPGPVTVYQADGAENASWEATHSVRLLQAAVARWTATDDDLGTTTQSTEIGATLGVDRSWRDNALVFEAGATYLHMERLAPPATLQSRLDRQANPLAKATWRHDLGRRWSTSVDAGVVYVNPVGTDPFSTGMTRHAAAFPVFGGQLAYSDLWGRATLGARRSVTASPYIAQNTVDDSAIAQLALPLAWLDDNVYARSPRLLALGSVGVERTRLVDPQSSALAGELRIARADVGLAWTPRPGQTYGLRYELLYQSSNTVAAMVIPSYHRNTVFFTFTLRPQAAPSMMPRGSQSVRADRSDLQPIGAEPVVPEAAAP
jgi:hypothetical protein